MHRKTSPATKPINWSAFEAELKKKPEKRPPGEGWMTFEELRLKYKVAKSHLYRCLRVLPHEVFNGFVTKDGRSVRSVWYRPKPE